MDANNRQDNFYSNQIVGLDDNSDNFSDEIGGGHATNLDGLDKD